MNTAVLLVLGGAAVLAASAGRNRRGTKESDEGGREGAVNARASKSTSWAAKIQNEGPAVADSCVASGLLAVEEVARCVAEELFPDHEWPAVEGSEYWRRRAWNMIIVTAREAMGMGPPIP
jgi:hypothetical protein